MKVLMVDDEIIILDLIVNGIKLLDEKDEIEFIGLVSTVEEAIEFCKKKQMPDLIIMDLQFYKHRADGISATFAIREMSESVKILIFSNAYEPFIVLRAFSAGADAFLPKGIRAKELLEYIKRTFSSSYKIIHPQIREELNGYNNEEIQKLIIRKEFNCGLNETEIKVIKYLQLPENLSLVDIAEAIGYDYNYVKQIVYRIYKTLGFVSQNNMTQKQQLLAWANVNLIGYDYLLI